MLFPYMCNVNNRMLDLDDLSDLTDLSSDESDNEEDFRPRSERSAASKRPVVQISDEALPQIWESSAAYAEADPSGELLSILTYHILSRTL